MLGNGADNVLSGGPGNDQIVGRGGTDTGNGGSGVDACDVEQAVGCES